VTKRRYIVLPITHLPRYPKEALCIVLFLKNRFAKQSFPKQAFAAGMPKTMPTCINQSKSMFKQK